MPFADYYTTIFRRKSVRSFKEEALDAAVLEQFTAYLKTLVPLDATIRTDFSIRSGEDIRTFAPIKVPHYLCIYSQEAKGYLVNAGYLLQQADLYLSANGIGACWLGLGLPKRAAADKDGLSYVICLVFGAPAAELHRDSAEQFRRKSMAEISAVQNTDLLEPCRLAPSASNTQPWYFSGSADAIQIHRKLPNPLKAALYNKFNQIDMGITLCHLSVAAAHFEKTLTLHKEDVPEQKGLSYLTTVYIS